MSKTLILSAVAVATLSIASAADAAITTFASFSPIGVAKNVRWANSVGTNAGTGGSLISTATATGNAAAGRDVKFSFLLPQLSPYISNVTAVFSLNGTVASGNPALLIASFLVQDNVGGSFSFLSKSAITINSKVFAAGSNLLSGSFSGAAITGARNGTSGSFSGSTAAGDSVTYTSDFLSFVSVADSDFAISLTSIASPLGAVSSGGIPTRSLRAFRAVASGTFSSDPAPIVTAVPEPQVWGLMVLGFGMVGVQVRRRARRLAVAA